MRILLKVTSSNEYSDGGCEFALVDLSPELAALALQRIAALRDQKTVDPNIVETYYWAYFAACYCSPYAGLAVDDMEVEGASIPLGDLLDELQIEDKEIVCVPESFRVRPGQVACVECEQMVVGSDSIAFTAIPNTPASMCRQLKFQSPRWRRHSPSALRPLNLDLPEIPHPNKPHVDHKSCQQH